jgi:hypothetical protein
VILRSDLGLVIICEHEPFVHGAVEVPSKGGVEKERGELGGEVGDLERLGHAGDVQFPIVFGYSFLVGYVS